MDMTLGYYREHARDFAQSTAQLDMRELQERFLARLPSGGRILDLGCGVGRDALYFHERGYRVEAVDGSAELCALAQAHTGLPVRRLLFSELSETERYDGVWACASLLHLPGNELIDVLHRIARALVPGGWLYASFKYGAFEGVRNGRYFTDLTEERFAAYAAEVPTLELTEQWISTDVRPGRGEERWLDLLLRRRACGAHSSARSAPSSVIGE